MEVRSVLKLLTALSIGGAAMWMWPTYGSCLGQEQVLDLSLHRTASLGCRAATAQYVDWTRRARIELRCRDTSVQTVNLAPGWPTASACGLELELLDHWQDGAGDEVIHLWVRRP